MSHPSPSTIQISRREVELCNTSGVTAILTSWVPTLLERNRNRVQMEVLGYQDDPRELFDIPEVRSFFEAVFRANPGLFYWIDVESYMFVFLGLMISEPHRKDGQVYIVPKDMQAYLVRGFTGLNQFCAETGASPDATNALVNEWMRT